MGKKVLTANLLSRLSILQDLFLSSVFLSICYNRVCEKRQKSSGLRLKIMAGGGTPLPGRVGALYCYISLFFIGEFRS